ncbi:MAG: cyanophycinase [Chloroflexota bacterium]|nr:cyanophycinase [Chloroflexota bacterium]
MTEEIETPEMSAPVASAPVRRVCQGPVMPIGGAEDKDGDGDEAILQRFVELAGGKQARIVVIPTASETPDEMGQQYVEVFGTLGAKTLEVLEIRERQDANAGPALEVLSRASGIFITGGAQSRLVTFLAGTEAMECIRRRNAEGVVTAGTSAGASILASHLMLGGTGLAGNSGDAAARKGMVELAAGFGLLQDIIVDQHFSQRGRMGRLLSVYAANPGLLSIGLDEDTAVVIDREGTLEVLGSGMVTIIDGRNARSDYFEREVGEVLTVVDSHLFVLGSGRRFDLDTRRPMMD